MYKNTLPIHRKVYDKANLEMYKLLLQIKELNPKCEFVGIKTDCLVFNKIKNHPPLSTNWGEIKKVDAPLIKDCTVNLMPKVRTNTYSLTHQNWDIINSESIDNYINKGFLITAMAGCGKTFKLKEIQKTLKTNCITLSPTSKACKQINGITIHKAFGINPLDNSFEYNKVEELYKNNVKYLLIDEVSMINEMLRCIISQITKECKFIVIGVGDFLQLKPVFEERIDFKTVCY